MIEVCILNGCQISEIAFIRCIDQSINIIFKRHKSCRSSLEMMMVRSRGSTLRTIVEENEIMILPGKVKHIHIPVPYRLIRMSALCNHKMVWKYRIWIYQNMVFLTLSTLELHHYLFCRAVFTTKKTTTSGYIFLAELCSGRHHSSRIELQLHT